VLSAAYAKVVPEEIYTQIRDNVFRSDVCRRKWEVHINANAQQVDNGIAIINVSHFYELENLNRHGISYQVSGGIDLDVSLNDEVPLRDQDVPKFKSIKIYDDRNPSLVLERHTTALLGPRTLRVI